MSIKAVRYAGRFSFALYLRYTKTKNSEMKKLFTMLLIAATTTTLALSASTAKAQDAAKRYQTVGNVTPGEVTKVKTILSVTDTTVLHAALVMDSARVVYFKTTKGAVTTATPFLRVGAGTPEGVITAPVGSLFIRSDGGAGTSFYVKQTGTGNTGWAGK